MKKSKAKKKGRNVRVGFNLCSHWCAVCQILPVLPSSHAAGLCFLDPLWLAGARSYEWRVPCVTSRLRISLLTWNPSRAPCLPLPSGLATSTTWDKGCSVSLGLWVTVMGRRPVTQLRCHLSHRDTGMQSVKASGGDIWAKIWEVSLRVMWISEEEGWSREMWEHSKELLCSRNSKEAGVAGARQMGYVGEDVMSNAGPGGGVTWKFPGVCWVNDRSNLIWFQSLVPFVILRRGGQAMGRLRKTSEGTFARTQVRAEPMPSCPVTFPVNNSNESDIYNFW